MKSKIKSLYTLAAATALSLVLSSCVKDKFSAPANTTATDPSGVAATMNLRDFKIRYCFGVAHTLDSAKPVRINDSIVLSGVINAADRTGNFYKQLILQDSTGGIQLKVEATGLYNEYPIGRRIFIKCKDLYIYNYLGTLEIGSYIDTTGAQPTLGGIPYTLLPTYVVKGALNQTLVPKKYTITDLNSANQIYDQSTLIRIDSVEFTAPDTGLTYSDPFNKAFGNINFQQRDRNTAVVRSSGYANFAAVKVPKGSGTLYGIFTIYQKSNGSLINQIGIRDTTDVQFTDPRFAP
ncbi:MAG: hypothetical protein JSS76_16050 [Bacteroidetes bacterium]|nr:hypothetical protein [Bacteroidota bacterium]